MKIIIWILIILVFVALLIALAQKSNDEKPVAFVENRSVILSSIQNS